ncbi:carbohydrate-binding family 9-like protein [Flexithrix dorotheae]|uniref:carbohydrate-binding family 9-like protein n=1 Tax=Flexithrix dorotheae TaxID=70993 RepID=UPI00037318E4|nr:carbohydrate-binding family 9-like protein [Flexithrix dorotheae]
MIKNRNPFIYFIITFGMFLPCFLSAQEKMPNSHYVAYQPASSISIDGKLEEKEWGKVAWTSDFINIIGRDHPAPKFSTRVKMLWDKKYFYIAAELEEPNLWSEITKRDAVIFHENDFEVFIDPDGDTHHYYEIEINALGTVWDLILKKPYRDGGPADSSWDIDGLKKGIHLDGTLNNGEDIDEKWTVELAIPWKAFNDFYSNKKSPENGEQWRVNFSRVHWDTEWKEGQYIKKTDPETGKNLPEYNWVWAPQGAIAMHKPEMWGFVQFSKIVAGEGPADFVEKAEEKVKWELRQLYYLQKAYFKKHKKYSEDLTTLQKESEWRFSEDLKMEATASKFEIKFPIIDQQKVWHIREDGKCWDTTLKK